MGTFADWCVADFSFGTPIQAVDTWASGTQSAMVEKNDAKATWMPMVSSAKLDQTFLRCSLKKVLLCAAYYFPFAVRCLGPARERCVPHHGMEVTLYQRSCRLSKGQPVENGALNRWKAYL